MAAKEVVVIELMANSLELRSMALLLRSMAILHTLLYGHEPRRPWLCCSADVHHAEYGKPLEQTGALELCEVSDAFSGCERVPCSSVTRWRWSVLTAVSGSVSIASGSSYDILLECQEYRPVCRNLTQCCECEGRMAGHYTRVALIHSSGMRIV